MALQNSRALWESCRKYLEQNIEEAEYQRLFSHVAFKAYAPATKTLTLSIPSAYIGHEIQKLHLNHLRIALLNTFGRIKLEWDWSVVQPTENKRGTNMTYEGEDDRNSPRGSIDPKTEGVVQSVAPGTASQHNIPPIASNLDQTKTFRTFIEGKSNRLSRSIGLRIAEHPSQNQFNPMFVFGPSGCGKTHLVNAIGNHCKKIYPDKRILYVSARTFQVQFSNAVMNKQINSFIAFYQTIDMLIVDDVQEWMTAKGTQDTFFHIFNHLYRNNRCIILVSDRAPGELEGMNKRLITRFSQGLLAEMEKPNYQLCVDILRKKIARDGLTVPEDVIEYIGQRANGSVRELEGLVNTLLAHSIVYSCGIDMKLVERVMQRAVKTDDQPLTIDDILECVCHHYEVTPGNVKSKSRKREFVIPRQITMFLARRYTNIPSTRIGRMIGNRDHSTVLHGIDQIEKAIRADKAFREKIETIEGSLKIKQ